MSETDARQDLTHLLQDVQAAREAAACVREHSAKLRLECEAAREASERTRVQTRKLIEAIEHEPLGWLQLLA